MYKKYIVKILYSFLFATLLFSQSVYAGTIVSSPIDVSVSAKVGIDIIVPPDDGGGGGSGFPTGVIFSGWAYPGASVHVWKNGAPKDTTIARPDGYFTIRLNEIYNPNIFYTLYAIDKDSRRSLLLNYPIVVKAGYLTQISGIRFAPTIETDKTEVKFGDSITVLGYALPSTPIVLTVEKFQDRVFHFMSNSDGTYSINLPLDGLKKGDYKLYVNYENDNRISKVIQFTIGDVNVPSVLLTNNIPGDCNADSIINIIDFSVAAFWYGKKNPPRCIDTNNDNKIDLIDFSILAFYWTG